jgi:hypothetical protein
MNEMHRTVALVLKVNTADSCYVVWRLLLSAIRTECLSDKQILPQTVAFSKY